MSDIRIKENNNLLFAEQIWDFFLRDNGMLDDREELATAVRIALGTDALASTSDILPDPDSTDRRGWWGNLEADVIWDGWDIGVKNWLLTRAKITQSPAEEGSTMERARQYTLAAVQPFIDKGIASQVAVQVNRTELQRIEVSVTIFRGPLAEIDLRYQLLWDQLEKAIDAPAPARIAKNILVISPPTLGMPFFNQKCILSVASWAVGSPVLGRSPVNGLKLFTAASFAVPSPTLTTATYRRIIFAASITVAPLQIGTPTLG